MKIMVINGPNLNMLGIREPEIYGSESYEDLVKAVLDEAAALGIDAVCLQTNHEGRIIDWIQQAYFKKYDGIILNPGGYTHTSVAIADAIKAVAPLPVVEVHITDISSREEFRRVSLTAPCCAAVIKGEGTEGYVHAMKLLAERC